MKYVYIISSLLFKSGEAVVSNEDAENLIFYIFI